MARIAGVNLPVHKHVWVGLQSIYGIGRSRSKKVCELAGVKSTSKIKDLTEAEVAWLVQEEWARTAEDVLWRRTKLGLRFTASQVSMLEAWMAEARQHVGLPAA